MLLVSLSYLFVSVLGLWDSYWFYRRFDIPVLEYMHSSDYFVSGLRRPVYLALLSWVLLAAAAALWPVYWRERNPERAAEIERHWWGRLLFPRRSDWWIYGGLQPETMTVLSSVLVMGFVFSVYSSRQAELIRAGGGHAVEVAIGSERQPLPGDWRMLGTSSAFVFLWDPGAGRAEMVPIEAIGGIRPVRRQEGPAAAGAVATP
ncbi:MAG: hypothetical protein KIS72_01955 [Luteimonas sp.]|nr:hypothetical protein [Luteimonas sp.]